MNKRTMFVNNDARFMTDEQTALYFQIGKTSARKLAIESGAIRKIGKTKRNDRDVMISYLESKHKK